MEFENNSKDEKNELIVGKYIFNKNIFEKVSNIILKEYNDKNDGILIIDEIGPLELFQKKGLYNCLINILENNNKNLKILFIVRKRILDEFLIFLKNYLNNETYKILDLNNVKDLL
jgi:nucleoside-triphosphatase THEP1